MSDDDPSAGPETPPSQTRDHRLYALHPEGWGAHVMSGAEKCYCHYQNPGESYFHLILAGEIFLQRGDEQVCLNCALRHGIVTDDRLYWQDPTHKANRRTMGL